MGTGNTTKPSRIRISLPLELERTILYFATVVFEDTNPYGVGIFDSIPLSRRNALRKTALGTRRNILRVCRLWNELGTQFLYADITIRTFEQLSLLRDRLIRTRPGTNCVGWWTKRLDIGYIHLPKGLNIDDYTNLVVEMLPHFPNLEILSDRGFSPPAIHQCLADTCGHSLKRIEWMQAGAVKGEELAIILRECPRLRSLSLDFYLHRTETCEPLFGLSFPDMQRLELSLQFPWQFEVAATWDLPSLRHLVILESHDSIGDGLEPKSRLFSFLDVYGKQLVTLEAFLRDNMDIELEEIIERCPNVRQLGIPVGIALSEFSTFKDVTDVGVYYQSDVELAWGLVETLTPDHMLPLDAMHLTAGGRLCDVLDPDVFPKLERIRLVDFTEVDAQLWCPKTVYDEEDSESWKECLEMAQLGKVRLEQGNGEPLVPLVEARLRAHAAVAEAIQDMSNIDINMDFNPDFF